MLKLQFKPVIALQRYWIYIGIKKNIDIKKATSKGVAFTMNVSHTSITASCL